MGIQWQFLSPSGQGNNVIGGTNLPASGSPGILDVTRNPAAIGAGLNVGLVRSGVTVGHGHFPPCPSRNRRAPVSG